ncbi:MAG: hypothetical protein WKF91_16345, partial [Segetibacter sp.]
LVVVLNGCKSKGRCSSPAKNNLHKCIIKNKKLTFVLCFSANFILSYFTATILEWKHLLKQDKYKDVIISSLEFLVKNDRIKVYGLPL